MDCPSTDRRPRRQVAEVAISFRADRPESGSRFDAGHHGRTGLIDLCDPIADPAGAARWELYAREGLGFWDEALRKRSAAQDLHVTFVADVVNAAADLRTELGRRDAHPVMAVWAEQPEISPVELNEQANGGDLPADARALWTQRDRETAERLSTAPLDP